MFRRAFIAALLAATPSLAQPVTAPDCTVDGRLTDSAGLRLEITYRCRATQPLSFRLVEDRASPYVQDLKIEQRDGVVEARYWFDLSGFARAVESTSLAVQRGNGVLAVLGSWLLEPQGYDRTPIIDIRMTTGPGLVFATGLPKVGDAWRLSGAPVLTAGYTALGRLAYREFAVPAPGSLRPGQTPNQPKADAVLRVAILDGVSESARADLFDWVERTAQAQSNYWQGFTAKQALLGLVPVSHRRGVGYGRSVPGGGVTVMVEVGTDVDRRRLFDDWVLTHELIHTGMPKGVRAFSGSMANARGQENYWGGATFMLLADVGLRRATDGAKGLEDCLAGVLWSGLDGARRATIAEYAAACDGVTGTTVMSGLVERHFNGAEPVDLAALWKDLGISLVAGRIALDDSAPSARWRKLIVPGTHPPKRVKLPWES
jgi:hypothetical protein